MSSNIVFEYIPFQSADEILQTLNVFNPDANLDSDKIIQYTDVIIKHPQNEVILKKPLGKIIEDILSEMTECIKYKDFDSTIIRYSTFGKLSNGKSYTIFLEISEDQQEGSLSYSFFDDKQEGDNYMEISMDFNHDGGNGFAEYQWNDSVFRTVKYGREYLEKNFVTDKE